MLKGDQKVKVPMEQAIIKPGYNTVKWFFFNHSMEKQNDFVFPPPPSRLWRHLPHLQMKQAVSAEHPTRS